MSAREEIAPHTPSLNTWYGYTSSFVECYKTNVFFFLLIFKNLTPEGLIDDNVSPRDEFHVQINDPLDKYQTCFIFNHTIGLLIERLLLLARCFCPLLIRPSASADVSSAVLVHSRSNALGTGFTILLTFSSRGHNKVCLLFARYDPSFLKYFYAQFNKVYNLIEFFCATRVWKEINVARANLRP